MLFSGCLALPKLHLQFLTLHDYLLRNFNLFRLESTCKYWLIVTCVFYISIWASRITRCFKLFLTNIFSRWNSSGYWRCSEQNETLVRMVIIDPVLIIHVHYNPINCLTQYHDNQQTVFPFFFYTGKRRMVAAILGVGRVCHMPSYRSTSLRWIQLCILFYLYIFLCWAIKLI